MTTTTTHQNLDTTTTPSAAPRSSAVTARRTFLVAAPVLAAAFTIVGAVGDPAAGINGSEMLKIYIENPSPLQWKSTGYHWAYAFWILPAFLGAADESVAKEGVFDEAIAAIHFLKQKGFRVTTNSTFFNTDTPQTIIDVLNFLNDEGSERVHDAYPGETWSRLAQIKRRYDPTNLFHRNQNVPPATS